MIGGDGKGSLDCIYYRSNYMPRAKPRTVYAQLPSLGSLELM